MGERPAIHKPAPVLDHGERHIGRSTCRSVPCAHGRSFVARLSKWQVGEHFRLAVEHERGGLPAFPIVAALDHFARDPGAMGAAGAMQQHKQQIAPKTIVTQSNGKRTVGTARSLESRRGVMSSQA
jgi:hypothetical protein